ncbi:ABC transporter ATP-binding protein [Salinisphaera sp. LB1]|uniref:ABC transporter ATP-binding protein n=1 Tax=Salinisphaera sp. LB1 TaxID=2183911 RepID=UPI000D708AFB|nr:ABC transporter ATP-binding protein [Salinisphaera sp. LB1]AWN15414.1 Putrescine transport ATP-binding protein PotA [Salinisphaera sp. LB1]
MTERNSLSVTGVRKSFGRDRILEDVNVAAGEAQLLVICGLPSTGKTTLARVICGLEQADAGQVHIADQDVTGLKPAARNIGYVPQSFALFPNMSVYKNIAYPLLRARQKKSDIVSQVRHMAEMLGIDSLLDKRVDQISGGQKQRVAIARGLVKKCALYVLDDPLVGLDFKLREQLALDLRLLQKQIGATFVYLTGDPLEPLMLGDNVAVLAGGRIQETAAAVDAYKSPQSDAMARVLGLPRANFVEAPITDARRRVACDLFTLEVVDPAALPRSADRIRMLIRPEHVGYGDPPPDAVHFSAEVRLIEDIGVDSVIHLQTAVGKLVACLPSARVRASDALRGTVRMWVRPARIRAYGIDSGRVMKCTFRASEQ